MAKYRVKVLATAYIGNSLREPGWIGEVEFEGPVPEHLELIDAPPAPPAPSPIDSLAGLDLV